MNILKKWKYILDRGNLPEGEKIDFVSKWLLSTRAEVFSMTITSVFIGVLLALYDGYYNVLYTILVLIALIFAHAGNNLINDYFDYKQGVDTDDYIRVKYSFHPLVNKLISEKELLGAFFGLAIIEFMIGLFLWKNTGNITIVFAIIGFLLSVFYVAPPFKLKYIGLGEITIFLIWGPLIIGGTYFVLSKTLPLKIYLASIPYGLVVTNVLLGKHVDKYESDKAKNIKTLPLIIGKENSLFLMKLLGALFYITVIILVLIKTLPFFTLIVFFSIYRYKVFVDILSTKKPDKKPEWFLEIWPLWYVVWAFWFNKLAGGLFVSGILLGIIWKLFW